MKYLVSLVFGGLLGVMMDAAAEGMGWPAYLIAGILLVLYFVRAALAMMDDSV
jgi:hypothetical protein